MDNELIEILYKIVKKNDIEKFKKNIDLFYEFIMCLNRFKELDKKTFEIVYFLIDKNQYFKDKYEYPYILSKLMEYLYNHQTLWLFDILNGSKNDKEKIDEILNEKQRFLKIKKLFTDDFGYDNSINKDSVFKYLNTDFDIFYLDALTFNLANNFLYLSKEKIEECMNEILNNEFMYKLAEGELPNSELKRDLIYKYIDRIIKIKFFISSEPISEDILISGILSNKLKDFKLIRRLFQKLNSSTILNIFDNDMSKILEFILNLNYIDEEQKYVLLLEIKNQFLAEKNFEYLFILYNFDDELIKKLLNEIEPELIKLLNFKGTTNKQILDFALDRGMIKSRTIIENYVELFNDKSVIEIAKKQQIIPKNEQEINIADVANAKINEISNFNLLGLNLEFNHAITLLNMYFDRKIELNINHLKAVIKSILRAFSEKFNIDVKIIFGKSNCVNGYYNDGKKIIFINEILMLRFLNNCTSDNFLRLLITPFHEFQHAVQFNDMRKNKLDEESIIMLEENILDDYASDYYVENYKYISYEYDARKRGFYRALNFIRRFFPKLNSFYENSEFDEIYTKSNEFNKKFSISDKNECLHLMMIRCIEFHPELLDEYPALREKYGNLIKENSETKKI